MPNTLKNCKDLSLVDWTPQQRAAYLTYKFMQGGEYTTKEVVEMLGYTHRITAHRLLDLLSGVLPLVFTGDKRNGKWHLMRGHNGRQGTFSET